jgi:lysophospholipase L1-like esterase
MIAKLILNTIRLGFVLLILVVAEIPIAQTTWQVLSNIQKSPLTDVTGDDKITVLGFGDSVTYGVGDGLADWGTVPFTDGTGGYLPRLAALLDVEVINEGSPGEEFAVTGIERLPKTISNSKADVVVIMQGYNDARSGLASEMYRKLLQRSINVIRSLGRTPVVASLAKSAEDHAFLLPFTRPYSNVAKLLSDANNTTFAHIYQAWNNRCPEDNLQCPLLHTPEGLHPNPLGYRVIAQMIAAALLEIDILTPQGITDFAQATGITVDQVAVTPFTDPVTENSESR